MLEDARGLIRADFTSFVRKAFYHDHGEQTLGNESYVDYLCFELDKVAKGATKRLVINLPPRHLKTFLAAVYLPAWILAKNPAARIIVVTYSDSLAEHITYCIRKVLQSPWYAQAFKTRVARDRSKVGDFATIQGGSVFATSVGGALAGRGADVIIFDDPLDLRDASNAKQIELVNQRFDSLIMSRLNNPKTGRVVIIAHRLNDNDLSAHVREQGGWRHIALPLIATRKKSYDLGYQTWRRKPGDLLRRGSHSAKQLKHLQTNTINPGFDLFYQQGRNSDARMAIKAEHFDTLRMDILPELPVILSVDPGQGDGPRNSFCVIQAWAPFESDHLLIEQWREQCGYAGLKQALRLFMKHFRPSAVLIEATANGPALISEAGRKGRVPIYAITPDNRSKAARLIVHLSLIRRRHIILPEFASWREGFVSEFVAFPSTKFDDQVDATTQYLDWIVANPTPDLPPRRGTMTGFRSDGRSIDLPQQSKDYCAFDAIAVAKSNSGPRPPDRFRFWSR